MAVRLEVSPVRTTGINVTALTILSSAINALHSNMMAILDEVYEKTGFIGMVLLAGPDPMTGRNITVLE